MSFDELTQGDFSAKREEIVIKSNGKNLTFYANEISYLQKLNLASIQSSGGDLYTNLVVYSITDQHGKHMTMDQARKLSPDHQGVFFEAAAKVNNQEKVSKKKSKSK